MQRSFNVDRMLKKAAIKPLAAVRRCRDEMERLEAGYQKGLYDVVAGAYAAAWHLKKRPGEWRRFLKKAFWKKARKPKGDKGIREELHRVMMYVCNAVSDQAYDRAYKYARALEPYLVEEVLPEKVRERIESDGKLEKLYDRAKKEIPLRTSRGKEPDDQEWNDADLTLEGRINANDEDKDGGQREHKSKRAFSSTTNRTRPGRLTLDVEISGKKLERVFAMSEGQEATVRIKALDVENGWHRFRATKLKTPANSGRFGRVKHAERGRRTTVSGRKVPPQRLATSRPVPSSISKRPHRR